MFILVRKPPCASSSCSPKPLTNTSQKFGRSKNYQFLLHTVHHIILCCTRLLLLTNYLIIDYRSLKEYVYNCTCNCIKNDEISLTKEWGLHLLACNTHSSMSNSPQSQRWDNLWNKQSIKIALKHEFPPYSHPWIWIPWVQFCTQHVSQSL